MKTLSVLMVAIGFVAGAKPVSGQAIHPQWSAANGDIVYYERIGRSATLWRVDPDTHARSKLLEDGGYNGNPSWSPDGFHIAFAAGRPNMDGAWQLYRRNLATGEDIQLTDTTARVMHSSWSPDGQWIAHVRMQGGNSDVWLVSADGTTEKQVTHTPGREFHPKWASDSKHMVFDAAGKEGREIHILNVATGDVEVVQGPEGTSVGVPVMSPDMKQLLFSCRSETQGQICMQNRTDGKVRIVHQTAPGASAGAPYFSPDGTEFVFHMSGEDGYAIYKMKVSGGTPVRLTF